MNVKKLIQVPVYESRWILVFFYLGLIIVQCCYCIKFCENVWSVLLHFHSTSESEFLITVLNLLDMLMIANLIKMIVSGSYQTFIDKLTNDHTEKVSSGALKIKMGTSLIGVSGINLLQTFLSSSTISSKEIIAKCSIHLVFLVSAMGLAYIEFMHEQCKALSAKDEPTTTNIIPS